MVTKRVSSLITILCSVLFSVWFDGCSNSTGTGDGGGASGYLTAGSIFVMQNQEYDSAGNPTDVFIDSLRVATTNGSVGGKYGCIALVQFSGLYAYDSQWYHSEIDGDFSAYLSDAPVPFTWMTYPFTTRSEITASWDTSGFLNADYVTENIVQTTDYVGVSELPIAGSSLTIETVKSVLIATINSQTEPGVIYDTTFISYSPSLGIIVAEDDRQSQVYTDNGLPGHDYSRSSSSLVSYTLK